MNITLIGMPGSGKSYIGKKVVEGLRYQLIELDTVMEEKYALPLQEILENLGEEAFLTEQEKDAILYTDVQTNFIASPGGSIIYSDRAMQHLKNVSKIIYLRTSFETIQKRVAEVPRGIVGLKNKTLEQLYEERVRLYEKWADVTLDAERDGDEVVEDIRKLTA